MQLVTISSKRQITIPKKYLDEFSFNGKAILEKEDGKLTIKPVKESIVEETAGSLAKYIPASKRGLEWNKVMAETKKITANKLVSQWSNK